MGSAEEPERKRRQLNNNNNHTVNTPLKKQPSAPSADDKKVHGDFRICGFCSAPSLSAFCLEWYISSAHAKYPFSNTSSSSPPHSLLIFELLCHSKLVVYTSHLSTQLQQRNQSDCLFLVEATVFLSTKLPLVCSLCRLLHGVLTFRTRKENSLLVAGFFHGIYDDQAMFSAAIVEPFPLKNSNLVSS